MKFFRKKLYQPSLKLQHYIYHFRKNSFIPPIYDDLRYFNSSSPYETPTGEKTLWLTVLYPKEVFQDLKDQLISIYVALKIGGDQSFYNSLYIERIDYGSFGNSQPFRICIGNKNNDNKDYFYVKKADASRIFGLELEHLLSPNKTNYLLSQNTLIEEHTAGLPGKNFIQNIANYSHRQIDRTRIAKEFVKFNERCFIKLLGDMRSVNYVVEITPDFEETQYSVRAIDFDQQSYNPDINTYLAHLLASNRKITALAASLKRDSIRQYASTEASQMKQRALSEKRRLKVLLKIMSSEPLAPQENIQKLSEQLNQRYKTDYFSNSYSMATLTSKHISHVLDIDLVR